MQIPLKKPEMTDDGRIKFATEIAFNALAAEAFKLGLPVLVLPFEQLGNADAQLAFEQGCAAIISALRTETKT
jgi:hypothetical protein